jgi:hypothetical protein
VKVRNPEVPVATRSKRDAFAVIVRALYGHYVSDRKIEALWCELIRAGLLASDDPQAPYKPGPPISPLH